MEILSRIIAFAFILILTPFLLLISLFCIIFQGFPILFEQERLGYHFKTFKIYKFRSMKFSSGSIITSPNDSRITKIGEILRKTKIDELPQLFNIIKGEMRFIGPRPEVKQYFSKKDFQFLKVVKPGISDFASIILRNESLILKKIGGNDPYKKLLPIKLELANYYSRRKSFSLDFKLVLITILSIFFPDSASKLLMNSELSLIVKDLKAILSKK